MTDLGGLLDPDRVAIVGATDRPGSVGRALVENMQGFDGGVIPINPGAETVLGSECFPSIGAVPDPETVDLAVVAVPARSVVGVLEELGDAGVRNVVVVSAGFGESGPEGERREAALVAVAEQYDLTLVGPNSVGLMNVPAGLNATFVQGTPPAGSISLMSQSGAFVAAVLGWAEKRGVGFNDVVSLGNEAVLDEVDFLSAWGDDPDTDVILAYLEDVTDGRAFIETASAVTAETPVVAIKSGRTDAGAKAAASHTGSIAGTDRAYEAAFAQSGVIRAGTVEAAFDDSRVLAGQPVPEGDDIAVVTNGGGPGVLAADAVGDSRLSMATFTDGTAETLERVLPAAADVGNPLDIIGDADLERFGRTIDAVLADPGVHGAVVLSVPTAIFDFEDLAALLGDVAADHGKPVVTSFMGGEAADRAAAGLAQYGIPNYFDPARAVASLDALARQRTIATREYDAPTAFDVDTDRVREILREAADRGRDYVGVEGMDVLDAYGIPTPAGGLAGDAAEAGAIAEEIGGPVVLKIVSPDIVHKSDVGGVVVDVPVEAARETYGDIVDRARSHDPEARILGVRVEELVDIGDETETIVGASRDAQFGPLVMFGLGGIFVGVFEDTSFRVAPVSEREAREMTGEITAAPMLRGARGRPPGDLDAVVETIQRVSQLVTDVPAITELDINPLVVGPDRICAVDFRLSLDPDAL